MLRRTPFILPVLLALAMVTPPLHAAAPKEQKMAEWDLLRSAYKTLSMTKKDYGGHRKKAMDAIEAACDKLNHEVRGERHTKEPQDISDAQLKEARSQLDEARAIVDARHQKEVTHNIEEAIRQVDLALEAK